MSDQTEHDKLGPIVASDSLGEVADFLEQRGHPGPAAAVRTLEYLLTLKSSHSLDHALSQAKIDLEEARACGMIDAILDAQRTLAARGPFTPTLTMSNIDWSADHATPLEDMRRMRDQARANSIGTLAIDGYRITREPGPVVRPPEGTYPVGSPRRVIADWLDARGLAGTGLRVETQEGPPINPPRVEIIMRRGDKFSLRRLEELDMVYLRSARDMVEILDDLYLRLCRHELTTA